MNAHQRRVLHRARRRQWERFDEQMARDVQVVSRGTIGQAQPPDTVCPRCGAQIPAQMSAGGYAPQGFDAEYDFYWCAGCNEAYDFDDLPPPGCFT